MNTPPYEIAFELYGSYYNKLFIIGECQRSLAKEFSLTALQFLFDANVGWVTEEQSIQENLSDTLAYWQQVEDIVKSMPETDADKATWISNNIDVYNRAHYIPGIKTHPSHEVARAITISFKGA